MSFFEFPHTRTYDSDLGWVIAAVKALKEAMETFVAANSLTFADPLEHSILSEYNKNTIVLDPQGNAYVSLQQVPQGITLDNADYWLMVFDYEAFLEKVNKNFTGRYYRNDNRAKTAMIVGDWLTFDDVLCKATAAIAVDDVLEIGVNIEHFTLEDFIKAFMTSANQMIQQYKNDIDASEYAYRQQLAQDIANTTASLQAQLDTIISGATVDSEVIDARVGWDNTVYSTLGQAIRTQITEIHTDGMLNHGIIATGTDLNDIVGNGIYIGHMTNTYTNNPLPNQGFTLEVIDMGSDGLIKQTLRTVTNTIRYTRRRVGLNDWSNWRLDTGYHGELAANTDFDDVKQTGSWTCQANNNYVNSPVINSKSCLLECVEFIIGSHYLQFVTQFTGEVIYYRCYYSGSWQPWKICGGTDLMFDYKILPNGSDLDDFDNTGIYSGISSYTYYNMPYNAGTPFILRTFNQSPGYGVQIIFDYTNKGYTYIRPSYSGVWRDWEIFGSYKNIANKLYAFGDSTTHGQRYDGTTSPNNYPKLVAKVLGMNHSNQGVNGQGLLKDWTTINNTIDGLDMSDADLIIVAWAYNDATLYPSTDFGSYTDVLDNTLIGKYYTIMKKFQQKCPTAKVILLTGYGYPNTYTDQFTHVYTFNDTTKTIKEIYDEQEKMCNLHGWSCINQSKGTFVNEFNYNTILGDNVHPTDTGYLMYSNFLAGQIGSLFANIKDNL